MSPKQEETVVGPGDALVIVDLQRDFLPGGNLAVPKGDAVIPVVNRYVRLFGSRRLPIVLTRDWHPRDHVSFKEQGGLWPVHCVAGTPGADFAPGLEVPEEAMVVSKAASSSKDAYSGFEGTDLDARLKAAGVRRLFVGGLATDYCVLNTVRDGLGLGYFIYLLMDAIQAVNVKSGDGDRAVAEMKALGGVSILLHMLS